MIIRPGVKFYVYKKAVDMRMAHNGLSGIILNDMKMDLLSGSVFIFVGKNRKACKSILWDNTGLVLIHKKLENGRFTSFDNLISTQSISHDDFYRIFNGAELKIKK